MKKIKTTDAQVQCPACGLWMPKDLFVTEKNPWLYECPKCQYRIYPREMPSKEEEAGLVRVSLIARTPVPIIAMRPISGVHSAKEITIKKDVFDEVMEAIDKTRREK